VTRIRGVAVVVPARDEEQDIDACLDSVRAAVRRLPREVTTAVTVVLDRCADRTPELVERRLAGWAGATSMRVGVVGGRRVAAGSGLTRIVGGAGVGALRDLGVREALARLQPLDPRVVWLLHTDADTTVPSDWALAHLRHAAHGVVGVAGMADLATPGRLSVLAARRHEAIVLDGTDGDRHRHVYGANLGVRADAYLGAGGFPPDGAGEDHALWAALRESGRPLRRPTAIRVLTSARTSGRASGGLADLLRDLHGEELLSDAPPAG